MAKWRYSLFISATTFVPICLYCLNCTKFGQLIHRKIIKTVVTISYFKAIIHQIRFRLGLCPRPPLGECPRNSSWIIGVLLLRGGRGREGEGRGDEGEGGGNGGEGKERERKGMGREDPLDLFPLEKFPSYATATINS